MEWDRENINGPDIRVTKAVEDRVICVDLSYGLFNIKQITFQIVKS